MSPPQAPCSHTLADSFSLFALFSTLASFVFNSLRTLFAKHRGYGVPLRHLRALRASALSFAVILWPLLFSSTYKSVLAAHRFATFSVFMHLQIPFPATSLYSHLYKTPGCHPSHYFPADGLNLASPEIFCRSDEDRHPDRAQRRGTFSTRHSSFTPSEAEGHSPTFPNPCYRARQQGGFAKCQ